MLDTEKLNEAETPTLEWEETEIPNGVPRWNHCSIMVAAIPSWKYFIFGGSTSEFTEGQSRSLGKFNCNIDIFDDATRTWDTPTLDDEGGLGASHNPEKRELTQVV